jgi:hypothetical protein
MMEYTRNHVQAGILSVGLFLLIGSGLFSVANHEWCLACQSFGMFFGWLAFWDMITDRIGRVDCKVGKAVAKLKQLNGEPDDADRPLGEDEYYMPPASSESLESL